MREVKILIELLDQKAKLVAMLAPSFPIVYKPEVIVGKLKRLGFEFVVEVASGARKTNEKVVEVLKKDENARFITSPCPSFVRMIRTKYPHLKKYLAFAADSPMVATAKMVAEKYPGFRPVFIGPCVAKKFESSEDYPNLNILVLTYKEMDEVFKHFGFGDNPNDVGSEFDISQPQTRLYPISGGLAESSGLKELLAEDRYEVISGWEQCEEAIKRFDKNKDIRLLDILFCDGGCINGPGIESKLSLDERRDKVIDFWKKDQKE